MTLTPKQLFLIDGVGALISALALGVVLPIFQHYFGVPISSLVLLASAPVLFVIYDLVCYFSSAGGSALKLIAFANLGYCLLSVSLLSNHFYALTTLAFIYFSLELVIVFLLAVIELRASAKK